MDALQQISWADVTTLDFNSAERPSRLFAWQRTIARIVQRVISGILDAREEDKPAFWKLLLLLPRWLLQPRFTPKGGQGTWRIRTNAFMEGKFAFLHETSKSPEGGSARPYQSRSTCASNAAPAVVPGAGSSMATEAVVDGGFLQPRQDDKTIAAAERLVVAGELSRAMRKLMSNQNVMQLTGETKAQLVSLHPPSSAPLPDSASVVEALVVDGLGFRVEWPELEKVLRKMSKGSAGGPSRWRLEHVQMVLAHARPGFFVRFMQLVVDGKVPEEVRPVLYGAALTPLSKPAGGVRPIAVGEVWTRIAGKLLADQYRVDFANFFDGRGQLGVSVRNGAEAAVLAVRRTLEVNPDWVLFKGDVSNAFNTVSRALILRKLQGHTRFAPLIPYFLANYATPCNLVFRDVLGDTSVIKSEEGVRQGDPLGPFFFALAFDDIIAPLVSEYADHAVLGAYLDDFFFVAPANRVEEIVTAWTTRMTESGSNLRAAAHKQECFSFQPPSLEAVVNESWRRASPEGTVLLGCPVGTLEFERAYWMQKATADSLEFVKLDRVRLKQSRMLLLRHCAVSRANFMLRSSAPDATLEAAGIYDAAILERVAALLECALDDLSPLQVQLPLRKGCLGLTSAVSIRDAAFLGALNDTAVIVQKFFPLVSGMGAAATGTGSQTRTALQVAASFQRLQNVIASSTEEDLPVSVVDVGALPVGLQKRLTVAVASARVPDLPRDNLACARFRSQSQRGAAAVWSAIPSEEGLVMNNTVFTTAVRLWLGLPVLRSDTAGLRCACATKVMLTEAHVLCCGMGKGYTIRHDAMVKTVVEMLDAAGFLCTLEPSGFPGLDEDSGPDVDVWDMWGYRHSVCIDVTVVNPLAASHMARAATTDLATASAREAVKVAKYQASMLACGRGILGAAIETTGAFGPGWLRMMRTCADRYQQTGAGTPFTRYGDTWSTTTFREYWSQRFAVQLRSGNEYMVSRVQEVARSASCRALSAC